MKQITRDRYLTPEEVAKYKRLRELIELDVPDLIAQYHERMDKREREMVETEVACYSGKWVNNQMVVQPVSHEELEALPEWVLDTINIGSICVHDGLMYGPSENSLTDEPLWS